MKYAANHAFAFSFVFILFSFIFILYGHGKFVFQRMENEAGSLKDAEQQLQNLRDFRALHKENKKKFKTTSKTLNVTSAPKTREAGDEIPGFSKNDEFLILSVHK